MYCVSNLHTQNELLLNALNAFYQDEKNVEIIMKIVNGDSKLSLRIVDWFVTNYAKKYYTHYELPSAKSRFKVYHDYKLKLKAYSKKRFDPFCRWERITIPYDGSNYMETTIGQLNFFKWAIDNKILDYIKDNLKEIEVDMNTRNSTAKKKDTSDTNDNKKTRKKREELSVSAVKCIKKETVKIVVKFDL